ncbi:REST corepressor 1, partial [Pteropus alecto]
KLARRSQERDNLGMLVWSPNQNLSEAKHQHFLFKCKNRAREKSSQTPQAPLPGRSLARALAPVSW